MDYYFPTITNIEQVRRAIKGRDSFIEADKGDYIVFNYVSVVEDTFPDTTEDHFDILRECRGLIFDKNGNVISRRFHKFFNVNERDEVALNRIDLSKPHVILEKLDGSMITPLPIQNEDGLTIRWASKMGITDVAMKAEEFVSKHPEYQKFANVCHWSGLTPIFEFCSRSQRIVVDYPEDNLILTAIRGNIPGNYLNYEELKQVSRLWNIPVVKAYDGSVESMEALMSMTKDLPDSEGFVLRFEDGHMVKIKSEWYVQLHKVKAYFDFEKDVIKLILEDKLDDLLPMLSESDRKKASEFSSQLTQYLWDAAFIMDLALSQSEYYKVRDRKMFALNCFPFLDHIVHGTPNPMNGIFRNMTFKMWDQKHITIAEIFAFLKDFVIKNCNTAANVEKVRYLFNIKWDSFNAD